MKPRIFLPIILAFACFSLLAQPKITSLTYDGDIATLTRNVPPSGIVYFWQGTSCGTLMTNENLTYLASTSSTFYLREYNSSGAVWATSCISTVVFFPDVVPPILSGVTTGPVEEGDNIAATSNEDGMIYLVPSGTAANLGDIGTAKVAEATATEYNPVSLATTDIGLGDFIVYAVDGSDNISVASAAIAVVDLTSPVLSAVSTGPVNAGDDILATSDEDGMVYLVPNGTEPILGDITSAAVAEFTATSNVAGTLATTGIAEGDYVVYAVDGSDNISVASVAITVVWATSIDPNLVQSDQVVLYPSNVSDILHIQSKVQVSSAAVYSLQGSQVIKITTPTEQIDMSGLSSGVYIVSLKLKDNTVFSGKVTKR